MKLNSHQLRKSRAGESAKLQKEIKRNPIVLVLDNVLDTYNIGSFFRLADAIAASKIYLCGNVITPPNIKIHRASIGTWKWIDWEQKFSTLDTIRQLKKNGYQIIGCEQNSKSIDYRRININFPVAIVAGSESEGISSDVLKECHQIVEIPLFGVNKSLNVLIATAIISYHIISRI